MFMYWQVLKKKMYWRVLDGPSGRANGDNIQVEYDWVIIETHCYVVVLRSHIGFHPSVIYVRFCDIFLT